MKKIISITVLSILFVVASSAVQAQNINAENPKALANEILSLGYKAFLGTDNVNDPLITSSANGDDFYIYFYGCDESLNVQCKSLQYSKGYDLDEGMALEQINNWNRENRFGRAYLDDENDPFIELDVNMDFGGVATENFADTFDWWLTVLNDFESFIGWNDSE